MRRRRETARLVPNVLATRDVPPIRVGISLRALFDLEDEHAVFDEQGVEAYLRLQRERETASMAKGVGFETISRLLKLNEATQPPRVEVVLLSRNAPDASLRAFAAMRDYGLNIIKGSFTNGGAIAPFLKAWRIDLFLSKERADVEAASAIGIAAATLGPQPKRAEPGETRSELRIAIDGDAVLFSDEADRVFAQEGLDAFLRHETERARDPLAEGPFASILRKLAALRVACDAPGRVRLALVTARTAPAHERVIRTLHSWGLEIDEAHYVGETAKAPILAAFGAHIFFDDQGRHILPASDLIATGHVPGRDGFFQT